MQDHPSTLTRSQAARRITDIADPPESIRDKFYKDTLKHSLDYLRARYNEWVLELLPADAKRLGYQPVAEVVEDPKGSVLTWQDGTTTQRAKSSGTSLDAVRPT